MKSRHAAGKKSIDTSMRKTRRSANTTSPGSPSSNTAISKVNEDEVLDDVTLRLGSARVRIQDLHAELKAKPIRGLVSSHKKDALVTKVTELREHQEDVFIRQFKQFPTISDYLKVEDSFDAVAKNFEKRDEVSKEILLQLDQISNDVKNICN